MACGIEARQVVRIVAEVGVHLEDILVIVLYRPFKACDISRSETKFSAAFDDEQAVAELIFHKFMNLLCRAVGRAVVYY